MLAVEWVLALTEILTGNPWSLLTAKSLGELMNMILTVRSEIYPIVHKVFSENGDRAVVLLTGAAAGLAATAVFYEGLKRSKGISVAVMGAAMAVIVAGRILLPAEDCSMSVLFFVTSAAIWMIFVVGRNSADGLVKFAVAFCGIMIICIIAETSGYVRQDGGLTVSDRLQAETETFFENIRFGGTESGMTSGNILLTSDKTEDGNEESEAVLTLTMSQPHGYYLKGYIGHRYTGSGWESLEITNPDKNNRLFYWLDMDNFRSESILAQAAQLTNERETGDADINVVTVVNHKASRKYFYIPYETKTLEGKGIRLLDGEIRPAGTRGQVRYTFTAVTGLLEDYPDIAAVLSKDINNEEVSPFLQSEANYRKFVYENYLELPEETEEALKSYLGDSDKNNKKVSTEEAKARIITALNEFKYDKNVASEYVSGDLTAEFLERKAGGDLQFATAAATALRYYGIPARIAEGYIITDEMTDEIEAGEEIKVTKDCAHCWAEYYSQGTGWIPFEVCPPYIGTVRSADNIKTVGDTVSTKQDNEEAEDKEPENETVVPESEVNYMTLAVFLLIIIIAAAALFIYMYRKKAGCSRKDFMNSDRKEAIISMMKYIRRTEARTQLMGEYAVMRKRMQEIYEEARYSNHTVAEDKYEEMLSFVKAIKKMRKKGRRLWAVN